MGTVFEFESGPNPDLGAESESNSEVNTEIEHRLQRALEEPLSLVSMRERRTVCLSRFTQW